MGSQSVAAVGTVLHFMDLLLKGMGGLTALLSQGRGWVQGRGISVLRCSPAMGNCCSWESSALAEHAANTGILFWKGVGIVSVCLHSSKFQAGTHRNLNFCQVPGESRWFCITSSIISWM